MGCLRGPFSYLKYSTCRTSNSWGKGAWWVQKIKRKGAEINEASLAAPARTVSKQPRFRLFNIKYVNREIRDFI